MDRKDAENKIHAARVRSRNWGSSGSWLLTPDSFTSCERETELVEALTSGRWPDACGEDLRRHAATCPVCADVVLVARALEQESAEARIEMALPTAGLVWWKAQMRARREAAERAVHQIKGVKSINNLIRIQPKVAPSEVKRKIEEAFKRSAELDARRITIEVVGNEVILRGTVRSWSEYAEAERAAWAAPGVVNVTNELVGEA